MGSSGPGCLHLPAPRQHGGGAGTASAWDSGCSWGLGVIASVGRGQSILGRCQIAQVFLSWLLTLVSQVLPLCGLLNKSLVSCPLRWQGWWEGTVSPCASPRLSFYSDRASFFPTPSLCAQSAHVVLR